MFCSFFLLSKSIYSQTPDWLWAKSAGGNNDDKGYAVATDTQGNVYAVGYFSSPTIVFGNTSLINAGGLDIFLVKYNTTGEVIWAKSAGGTLNDVGFAICVDPSGNVLITGYFNSPSLLFGTTNLINVDTILNAYDYDDVFVAKYSADGVPLWANSGGGSSIDDGKAICSDSFGNIFVSGNFLSDSISFADTILNIGPQIYRNSFVVKYNTEGVFQWVRSYDEGGVDYSYIENYNMSVDGNGNILTTGKFAGSILIDTTIASPNFYDSFYIIKYNTNGELIWFNIGGGLAENKGTCIKTDISGNIIFTLIAISPTVVFGNTTFTNSTYYDLKSDTYVAKYDENGEFIWAKSFEGIYSEGIAVANCDGVGNIIVTGITRSPILIFGTDSIITGNDEEFFSNFFIAKLSAGGELLWVKITGESIVDNAGSSAIDLDGNIFVTGSFNDSSTQLGATTLSTNGANDFLIAKLDTNIVINNVRKINKSNNTVTVFPNPSSGVFKIKSNLKIKDLEIYNVFGERVFYSEYKDDKTNINLELLPKGIYFLKVHSTNETLSQKIIIE